MTLITCYADDCKHQNYEGYCTLDEIGVDVDMECMSYEMEEEDEEDDD